MSSGIGPSRLLVLGSALIEVRAPGESGGPVVWVAREGGLGAEHGGTHSLSEQSRDVPEHRPGKVPANPRREAERVGNRRNGWHLAAWAWRGRAATGTPEG